MILTVLAVNLFLCSPARAFFPSDEEMNDTMYQNYGTLTSYEAVLTFPAYPGASMTIKRGHDHWQQTLTEENGNSTVTAKNVGQYFKTIASCPSEAEMPVSVLQLWSPDDPVSDWMSLGVNNATRSYGFYDSMPVFVFGAEAGDETSPQIWFDNENFSPIKINLGGERIITFGNYTRFAGFMLPHSGVFRSGEETLDFRIEWRGIRKKISPAVFSPSALVKDSGCVLPSGPVYEMLEKCLRLKLTEQ